MSDVDKYMKHYIDEEKAEMFDKIKELLESKKPLICGLCRKVMEIIED